MDSAAGRHSASWRAVVRTIRCVLVVVALWAPTATASAQAQFQVSPRSPIACDRASVTSRMNCSCFKGRRASVEDCASRSTSV